MKLAIWLPNWIGDVVMATPALRALRQQFVDAEIVGVVRPYVADVLAGTTLLDRMLIHESRSNRPSRTGWGIWRSLRRERFDLAVVMPNSFRSAWWAWASGAKRTLGYARNGRSLLLTDPIFAPSLATPHPVLDELLQLVGQLGCRGLSRRMELATLPQDEQRLAEFWQRHGDPPIRSRIRKNSDAESSDRPNSREFSYVCLNTGGAFGAAKDWPIEHFTELARRIAVDLGRTVLILCGPNERTVAQRIVADVKHAQVVSLTDEPLSIGLTKVAIRHSDLLITTDSGPRHFAAAFDVPAITLFGPTHIAWSETFHPQATHLQLPVDCGPCQQRVCPLGHHRCMRDLSVDHVFREVVRVLPTKSRAGIAA
jgi:lipopolysaccharide heptosyltransferase II